MDQNNHIIITKYQDALPQQIVQTSNQIFIILLKGKVFKVNKKFDQSQKCLQRLVEYLRKMQVNKQNLKLAKQLVKHYQLPIFIFLQDFYLKVNKFFIDLENDKVQTQNFKQKTRKISIKILQQIGKFYEIITLDKNKPIDYFSYFKQYGLTSKQIELNHNHCSYFNVYYSYLQRNLHKLQKIMQQNDIQLSEKFRFIEGLEQEMYQVVQKRDYFFLQRMTMKYIQQKVRQNITNYYNSEKSILKSIQTKQSIYQGQNSQGMFLRQIEMEELKHTSPCCRTFFYQYQQIKHAETFILQYKNFKHPYDKYCINKLRSTICGFLNRQGGILLIGIKQQPESKYKQVIGQFLSENSKEEVLKSFRHICSSIEPDIVTNVKYTINFIPIKNKRGCYVSGKYVVKARIQTGDTKHMYSYREMINSSYYERNKLGGEFTAFRTANQVLRRQVNQQILSRYKNKLLHPNEYQALHMCPLPQIGEPILYDKKDAKKPPTQIIISQRAHRNVSFNNKKRDLSPSKNEQNKSRPTKFIQKKQTMVKNFKKSNQTKQQEKEKEKPSDIIYFKGKNSIQPQNRNNQQNLKKKSAFGMDQQQQEKQRGRKERLAKLKQCQWNSQKQYENDQREKEKQLKRLHDKYANSMPNQSSILEFMPKNNVPFNNHNGNKKQYHQKKENYNFDKNYNRDRVHTKPVSSQEDKYVISRKEFKEQQNINQRPVKNFKITSTLELLIVGVSFVQTRAIIYQADISLIQQPIQCHDKLITWLKCDVSASNAKQKLDKFQLKMVKHAHQKNIVNKMKIRKVFKNLRFDNQVYLNQLIARYKHGQKFLDQQGVYYYACKDNRQAIEAYIMGWRSNIKVKFLSDEDLKAKQKQYLKYTHQKLGNKPNLLKMPSSQ